MAWRALVAVAVVCTMGASSVPRKLINGGFEVDQASVDADYPWFVVFVTVNDCQAFCGGALIGPATVLTAAHCFFDAPDPGIENPGVRAILGYAGPVNTPADPTELQGCDLPDPDAYKIKTVRKPIYYQYKSGYDLALVTLDDAAGCPSVKPVKIAGAGFDFSTVLGEKTPWTLLGFGATERESNAPAAYLKGLQSTFTSVGDWDANCNHKAAKRIPSLTCVEEEPDWRQAGCGDSGGPWTVLYPDLKIPVLVGVVSSSETNDAGTQFGYNVNPAWFQDWIASSILSTDPCLPEPPPASKSFFVGYERNESNQFCSSRCASCSNQEVTNPGRMRGKRAPQVDGCHFDLVETSDAVPRVQVQATTSIAVSCVLGALRMVL